MKKILASLLAAFALVTGAQAAGGALVLDKFPKERVSDLAALQNGAKLFVNYCLNCHSAAFMRFNRLTDIGLTEQQIKDNLLFPTDKVGEVMKVSLDAKDAKAWFGALPPDLTLVARSRASGSGSGADYLYTYLRTFYRDDGRPTGWNNLAFEAVGMPHVLWELQGTQVMDPSTHKLSLAVPGKLSPAEYDKAVSDLVSFMVWMAEPQQEFRKTLGYIVLAFLALLFVVAYALKKEYWKDIH